MQLFDLQEPKAAQSKRAFGIDLGTTNSLIAEAKYGVFSDVEKNSNLMPSVMYYEHGMMEGGVIVRSIKRLMGKSIAHLASGVDVKQWPTIISANDGSISLSILGQLKTPSEISADILRTLRKRVEDFPENERMDVVITVPAHFDEAARAATRQAAELANMKVLRLINEPTAAAIAYHLDEGLEGVYAVYDMGGGTFDVSILKMECGVFRVIATSGDNYLGGDDFNYAILQYLANKYEINIKLLSKLQEYDTILQIVQKAREELTSGPTSTFNLASNIVCTLTRSELDAVLMPYVQRSIELLKRAIYDSSVDDIKAIILVGGSTRTPLIQEQLASTFDAPILCKINPDEVVVKGAAIQAQNLIGPSDSLLIDVTPLSLGIELANNVVERIIHRNTQIPAEQQMVFTTSIDNQKALKVHILQGEGETVDDCRTLGQFELLNLPPALAGTLRVVIIFRIDADGMLKVEAYEQTSGIRNTLEVRPSYGLSAEKIKELIQ